VGRPGWHCLNLLLSLETIEVLENFLFAGGSRHIVGFKSQGWLTGGQGLLVAFLFAVFVSLSQPLLSGSWGRLRS